jgi:predicted RNase H-like nuclease
MIMNGSGRDFTTVIVNGRTVVKDRQIPGIDFAVYRDRAQRQYDKLRASYPERSHLHPPVEEIFQPAFPIVRGRVSRPMATVVGVDGCPGGWVAIHYDPGRGTLEPSVHVSFADLLSAHAAASKIGVDIPIGLSEEGPRACDLEARKVLLWKRSSVFPAPDPRFVHASTYAEALAQSYQLCGKGISRQAFGIYAKVAEVNDLLTPADQDRVFEVHPEVAFWAMNGCQPMQYSKKMIAGFIERRDLIQRTMNVSVPGLPEIRSWARPAQPDDLLDAIAVAWTAHRIMLSRAKRLPEVPPVNYAGMRMEIVY